MTSREWGRMAEDRDRCRGQNILSDVATTLQGIKGEEDFWQKCDCVPTKRANVIVVSYCYITRNLKL